MSDNQFPLEPEFASAEDTAAYARWFHEKVQASLDDQRPTTPHDEVMASMRKIIRAKRDSDASDPMAS
jgi:hypothetical protein